MPRAPAAPLWDFVESGQVRLRSGMLCDPLQALLTAQVQCAACIEICRRTLQSARLHIILLVALFIRYCGGSRSLFTRLMSEIFTVARIGLGPLSLSCSS